MGQCILPAPMDATQAAETGQSTKTTRLAPSPTGALHLGNARTFLINWALARRSAWKIVLRLEDLDTPRIKPGVIEQTVDTLAWLGLDWDERAPLQSENMTPSADAMRRLAERGAVYPCSLSRSEIEAAASAPNEGEHERRFPPELRPPGFRAGEPAIFDDSGTNWRLAVEPGAVRIDDVIAGPVTIDVSGEVGDFVVWTKRGQPSYQLAVVVDDAASGVTDVVRGNDLLGSAARQSLLHRHLDLGPPPRYWHVPLVRGEDGRRLAKRHGDTRVDSYRQRGVAAERVIGLLAWWSGVGNAPEPMSAEAFASAFRLDTMPREDITFREVDDRWLTEQ
jgi:glutamyl-tRNA synthetase